jgi:hypothetical protein
MCVYIIHEYARIHYNIQKNLSLKRERIKLNEKKEREREKFSDLRKNE